MQLHFLMQLQEKAVALLNLATTHRIISTKGFVEKSDVEMINFYL
jgi:hypothetical protein